MRGLILLVVSVVYVHSQSQDGCTNDIINFWQGQFLFPRNFPDHGGYGSCYNSMANGETCSISCDSNSQGTWLPVGDPYTCTNGQVGGGPMKCAFQDYVPGKRNCTVGPWSQYAGSRSADITDCSFKCGGGTQTWTRAVLDYGEPGGEPCPILSYEARCGPATCPGTILAQGYYYWGPFCTGATQRKVDYWILTSDDIDIYVFNEPDFNRYTWDSALTTPQNAYYAPVQAYLTTHFEHDTFVVPPNKCYYLVIDNTNVGPTKATGQNGQFEQINIAFALKGISAVDGFTDFSMQQGLYQPAAAVQSSSVSFFGVFLTAIVMLILKLE